MLVADCDVDAANLHILFTPQIELEQVYIGAETAVIDYSKCTNCGLCSLYCRFDAINFINQKINISEVLCDGCKLCSRICPEKAVTMVKADKSRLYSGSYRNGKIVYGILAPGEENSGKLVNIVRDKAKEIAAKDHIKHIIVDGPPGIGCPVISAITGVDNVIIVTEPSMSGLHDLKRTIELTSGFNLKTWVIINKYDLNIEVTEQIELYCKNSDIRIVAKLPFDKKVVESMVNCKSMTEWDEQSDFAKGIFSAYKFITNE